MAHLELPHAQTTVDELRRQLDQAERRIFVARLWTITFGFSLIQAVMVAIALGR